MVVAGHAGKLLFGFLEDGKEPVVLMVGRSQSVDQDQVFTWEI